MNLNIVFNSIVIGCTEVDLVTLGDFTGSQGDGGSSGMSIYNMLSSDFDVVVPLTITVKQIDTMIFKNNNEECHYDLELRLTLL